MKKLMIAAAIVCAAVMSHAAATDWELMSSVEIPGVNGSGTWSGTALISCDTLGYSESVEVSDGMFDLFTSIDSALYTDYTFTITATDALSGKTYSASAIGAADDSFGGLADFGTPGTWTAVPEPTSGLLLLLGVAGLALKRKRA